MNQAPTVAVVVPALDARAWLPTTLRSLRDQTQQPSEVVVVDCGSRDGTPELAAQAGATCVHAPGANLAAARNRGIAATRAEMVAFLDADDWFAPNKLERQVQVLTDQGASVIACDAWVVDGETVRRTRNHGDPVPAALTMERLVVSNPVLCSTVVARRNSLEQVGGFDEDPGLGPCADYDLWLRLSQREPLAYLDEPLGFHRQEPWLPDAHTTRLQGIDCVLDKLATNFAGEAHFQRLQRQRRATARLEVAGELLAHGDRAAARSMARAACRAGGPSWACLRMWVRTFLPTAARS